MRANRQIWFSGLGLFFSMISSTASAQSEVEDAAIRLKQAHVVRYFESCMDQIQSDVECRAELKALHPREKAALGNILTNSSSYAEFEVGEASSACYDPDHDYLDLIECWELLATKMAAGEDIKPDAPKPVASLSDIAREIFSELTPTQQKSVVLCVRGRVSINYKETVAHNLKLGGSNALWALKINGFENAQMSILAKSANWTKMTGYFEMEADNVSKLIRGEIDFDKYRLLSKNSQEFLSAALAPERSWQSAHGRNFQKFARECEELASKIIGSAKVAAAA